ncbi:MAG: DUF2283 domain-containing protein [Anaerolineales bacterium]|nr:DUF2283 domain-containing protein [Anaerolineales bacterium]
MESKKLKITYYEDKDILYLQILPARPAKVEETKYGFMVRYDWDDPEVVVGFECLDFSLLVPHLAEPGILPEVRMRFDIQEAGLKNTSLREALIWTYQRYVLRPLMVPREAPLVAYEVA